MSELSLESNLNSLRQASQLSGSYQVKESANSMTYEHMGQPGAMISTKKEPGFVAITGSYDTDTASYVTYLEKNQRGSFAKATIHHHDIEHPMFETVETTNPATVQKLTALIAEQAILHLPVSE